MILAFVSAGLGFLLLGLAGVFAMRMAAAMLAIGYLFCLLGDKGEGRRFDWFRLVYFCLLTFIMLVFAPIVASAGP